MKLLTLLGVLVIVGCSQSSEYEAQQGWVYNAERPDSRIYEALAASRVSDCPYFRYSELSRNDTVTNKLWIQCGQDGERWVKNYVLLTDTNELERLSSTRQIAKYL